MAQEKSNVVPISDAATQPPDLSKTAKSKPSRTLPTERVVFQKQLNLLRAYAAASSHGNKAVKTADVADIVKMAPTTVSLTNAFFLDVGFVQKTETGFMPAPEVLAFAQAYEWNQDTATQKLAPLLKPTWFANILFPKLAFDKLRESDAIADLGQAATAGTEYKSQLKMLIDYLEAAGLVQRDGEYLRKTTPQQTTAPTPPAPVERASHPSSGENKEPREVSFGAAGTGRSNVSTAFTQMTGGRVQFNISVNVDMAEFSGWSPDRITAFFAGIAQVLAAKGAVEQKANMESLE